MECGGVCLLSHGAQTFSNQSIARNIPKSKRKPSNRCKHVSRKDSKNTNVTYALLCTACYELRWAEGTETFTGFTSAMACGQARLTRAAHSKWMTWKCTDHHVLNTCRIHSPSLKTLLHFSGKFGETNPQSQNEII